MILLSGNGNSNIFSTVAIIITNGSINTVITTAIVIRVVKVCA
jgi:hypothetical protein